MPTATWRSSPASRTTFAVAKGSDALPLDLPPHLVEAIAQAFAAAIVEAIRREEAEACGTSIASQEQHAPTALNARLAVICQSHPTIW